MVKRIGSFRRKTRHKLQKPMGEKGKILVTSAIRSFNVGEIVVLKANPTFHKGMYHPRFHGMHGKIVAQKGKCYEVEIKNGGKVKKLVVNPIHLKG